MRSRFAVEAGIGMDFTLRRKLLKYIQCIVQKFENYILLIKIVLLIIF